MPDPPFKPDNPHGLILYDHPSSPCARRVRITLLEKGLAWETQIIDLSRLEQRRPEYLRLNPNGFVPTLAHGEWVLYDAQLIAEYLDRIYTGNPLYPDDAYQMAQVRMWLALEAGTHKEFRPLFYLAIIRPLLQAAGVTEADLDGLVPAGVHPSHVEWLRDTLRGTPRFDSSEPMARDIIAAKLEVVEAGLAGRRYLVGDACTMADLGWFTRIDLLPRLGVALPPARYPNITRWAATIAARPSVSA
jgi:glutathione S-transferase